MTLLRQLIRVLAVAGPCYALDITRNMKLTSGRSMEDDGGGSSALVRISDTSAVLARGFEGTISALCQDTKTQNIFIAGDFDGLGKSENGDEAPTKRVGIAYMEQSGTTRIFTQNDGIRGRITGLACLDDGIVIAGGSDGLFQWNGDSWRRVSTGPAGLIRSLSASQDSNLLLQGFFSETADGSQFSPIPASFIRITSDRDSNPSPDTSLSCGRANMTLTGSVYLTIRFSRRFTLTSMLLESTGNLSVSLKNSQTGLPIPLVSIDDFDTEKGCERDCRATGPTSRLIFMQPIETDVLNLAIDATFAADGAALSMLQFTQSGGTFISALDEASSESCVSDPFKTRVTGSGGTWSDQTPVKIHTISDVSDTSSVAMDLTIDETGEYELVLPIQGCGAVGLCALRDFVQVNVTLNGADLKQLVVNARQESDAFESLVTQKFEAGATIRVTLQRSAQAQTSAGSQIAFQGLIVKRVASAKELNGYALYDFKSTKWTTIQASPPKFDVILDQFKQVPPDSILSAIATDLSSLVDGTINKVLVTGQERVIVGGNFSVSTKEGTSDNLVGYDASAKQFKVLTNDALDGEVTGLTTDASHYVHITGLFKKSYVVLNPAMSQLSSPVSLEGRVTSLSVSPSGETFLAGKFTKLDLPARRGLGSGDLPWWIILIIVIACVLCMVVTVLFIARRITKRESKSDRTSFVSVGAGGATAGAMVAGAAAATSSKSSKSKSKSSSSRSSLKKGTEPGDDSSDAKTRITIDSADMDRLPRAITPPDTRPAPFMVIADDQVESPSYVSMVPSSSPYASTIDSPSDSLHRIKNAQGSNGAVPSFLATSTPLVVSIVDGESDFEASSRNQQQLSTPVRESMHSRRISDASGIATVVPVIVPFGSRKNSDDSLQRMKDMQERGFSPSKSPSMDSDPSDLDDALFSSPVLGEAVIVEGNGVGSSDNSRKSSVSLGASTATTQSSQRLPGDLVMARVVKNWKGRPEYGDMDIIVGDMVRIVDSDDSMWWLGEVLEANNRNTLIVKKYGVFPKDYVQVI